MIKFYMNWYVVDILTNNIIMLGVLSIYDVSYDRSITVHKNKWYIIFHILYVPCSSHFGAFESLARRMDGDLAANLFDET